MKKNWNVTFKIAVALLLGLGLITGCGSPDNALSTSQTSSTSEVMGVILLSVNPEIEVSYDNNALVLGVEGANDDGKSVVSGYTDYQGKPIESVVNHLVEMIFKAGYFDIPIGGKAKNIIIKLEEGSSYPDNDFLERIAENVKSVISEMGISSAPMIINEDDFAENGYIGIEKAKELVLAQLGLSEASFTEKEYALDDGVYELEFTANGVEYEFEVDAVTGKILEADYENNDDWNDDRDDSNDTDEDDDINEDDSINDEDTGDDDSGNNDDDSNEDDDMNDDDDGNDEDADENDDMNGDDDNDDSGDDSDSDNDDGNDGDDDSDDDDNGDDDDDDDDDGDDD